MNSDIHAADLSVFPGVCVCVCVCVCNPLLFTCSVIALYSSRIRPSEGTVGVRSALSQLQLLHFLYNNESPPV